MDRLRLRSSSGSRGCAALCQRQSTRQRTRGANSLWRGNSLPAPPRRAHGTRADTPALTRHPRPAAAFAGPPARWHWRSKRAGRALARRRTSRGSMHAQRATGTGDHRGGSVVGLRLLRRRRAQRPWVPVRHLDEAGHFLETGLTVEPSVSVSRRTRGASLSWDGTAGDRD